MKINKEVVCSLPMSYAVSLFDVQGCTYAVAASEGPGRCVFFPLDDAGGIETVWDESGGTMSIVQTDAGGSFLAVQNFFKGFQSKTAKIVRATRSAPGAWSVEDYLPMPYVHRFDLVDVGDARFLIACTLCDDKDFKEDWSRPGRVWLGRLDERGECTPRTLIEGVTKNHGYWRGIHDGRDAILVTGMEGVFEITPPQVPDGMWEHRVVLAGEVSEAIYADLDGDGEDELVTIEPFHGNRVVIYKAAGEGFTEVYSMRVNFGHVLWGGDLLGEPTLLVGYRQDDAALLMLRKTSGAVWEMEARVIDEGIGPTNISVQNGREHCTILCSAGMTQQVILYRIDK